MQETKADLTGEKRRLELDDDSGRLKDTHLVHLARQDEAEPEDRSAGGAQGGGALLRTWLRDVTISLAVSFIVITFLYQPVRVEGTSMLPQLEDQERLFISKFSYRVGDIHRGDVVVFHYPRDPEKSYIKRVIAGPGDAIWIDHGKVYVNGELKREPYVPRRYRDDRSLPQMVVPMGEYFMMGDHRSISSDSRDFGPVEKDLVYGKAVFVYWPADKMGVVR